MFDINTTMDSVLDTTVIPHPTGEFTGQIQTDEGAIGLKQDTAASGRKWAMLTCKVKTLDPGGEIEKQMGRPPFVTLSVMLDVTESGQLDSGKGRNVQLGQLREDVGQNKPGPWSFANLAGQTLRYKVDHEPAKDGSGKIYTRVTQFTKP